MKKLVLSVDDGCASDVRVAEIGTMNTWWLDLVFYWPVEWRSLAYEKGYEPLSYWDARDISAMHEIGAHTITHRHLTAIPYEEAFDEIVECGPMLEQLFPKAGGVTKFCPPRGYTNDKLTEITLQNYKSQRLTRGEGLVHVHPNSGANNNMPWREYAKTIDVKELWGHSWEFDKFNLWSELEDYIGEFARENPLT